MAMDRFGSQLTEAQTVKLAEVVGVIKALRQPETGCPWDIKQTHTSLKRYLIEEAYEVLEAIDADNAQATQSSQAQLMDELGDVLLQVLLHAQIASDEGRFDIADVADNLSKKMIRRHPHVFATDDTNRQTMDDIDEQGVVNQWEAIKQQERSESDKADIQQSILNDISTALPALMRATKLSKRAVKHGFAWPDADSLWACVMSEFDEFKAETTMPVVSKDRLEDEMGDILFALVSLANHYGVDAETALMRGNQKFTKRFQTMEARATKPLDELTFDEWDGLWKQAKQLTNPSLVNSSSAI
jgi:MazG family protein